MNDSFSNDNSSVGYRKEEDKLGVSLAEVLVIEKEAESEDKFLKSLDNLNLDNLTAQEKVSARAMLLEERDSFAKDEIVNVNAPDLQMDIHKTDEVPVQKS